MLGFCGITSAPAGSSGAAGVGVPLYRGAVQRLAPGEWGASAVLHCCFHVAIRMLPCNISLLFLAPISFLSLALEPSGFLSQSPLLFKKFLFLFFFNSCLLLSGSSSGLSSAGHCCWLHGELLATCWPWDTQLISQVGCRNVVFSAARYHVFRAPLTSTHALVLPSTFLQGLVPAVLKL